MPPITPLHVVHGQLSGSGPMDTAVSRAILQRVTNAEIPETLQLGTPHKVVAFGKHDTLSDGFVDAATIAVDHGYDPTIRIAGGRAVTFSPSIVRFAWTLPVAEPARSMHARFKTLANAVVRTLASFGVDAAIGEVPNEYCAGQYSAHVLGKRKVMGVGQRLTRTAAQVGGMIVLSHPDEVNEVLVPVYEALGVPMDPAATGSVADVQSVDASDLSDALANEIAQQRPVELVTLDQATLELGRSLEPAHLVSKLA